MRSMPGSRSGSPPITLPPLKVPSKKSDDNDSDDDKDGDDVMIKEEDEDDELERKRLRREEKEKEREERVELPGFSEFEAAARGLPAPQKMSIDFVR